MVNLLETIIKDGIYAVYNGLADGVLSNARGLIGDRQAYYSECLSCKKGLMYHNPGDACSTHRAWCLYDFAITKRAAIEHKELHLNTRMHSYFPIDKSKLWDEWHASANKAKAEYEARQLASLSK